MKDGRGKDKHQAAASTASSHAAAAALRKRLVEIAGDAFVSDRAAEDIDPILAVIANGAVLELDVLPVVAEFATRSRSLSTWKPVAMEIEARIKAAAASNPVKPEDVDWPLMVGNFRKRQDLASKQGKAKAAEAKVEIARAENAIKAALGDAEVGTIKGEPAITWKQQTRQGYTVETSTFRQLRTTGAKK